MAYTLGDIVTRVQKRIKDTSFSASDIKEFINDEQRAICNEYDLPVMETSINYTLSVGVQDITNGTGLPADFSRATSIIITTDSFEKVLKYIDYKDLDNVYPDQADDTSGVPIYWYKYGNTIKVYPEPDIAYAVTLKYYKSPDTLTDDADIPELPSSFEEVFVYGGSYRVWEVKDRFDKSAILENKRNKIVSTLVTKLSSKQTGQDTRMKQPNRRSSNASSVF